MNFLIFLFLFFYFFRKFVTKNRAFGNKPSFLQHFFRFRVGGGISPLSPLSTPLRPIVPCKIGEIPISPIWITISLAFTNYVYRFWMHWDLTKIFSYRSARVIYMKVGCTHTPLGFHKHALRDLFVLKLGFHSRK